jgi:hypothetical protein
MRALPALVLLAACSHDDLFVKGVLAPPGIDIHSTAACVYAADGSAPLLSSGIVDVALTSGYDPTFLVGNTGGDRVALTGATVHLVDQTGNMVAQFDTMAAGSVDPGNSDSPSYGALTFHLVDPATLSAVAQRAAVTKVRISAYVTVHGTTSGGDESTSQMTFPIDVCNGCLVSFPPEAQDPSKPTPNCAAPIGATEMGTRPCVVGQDQVADCRLCQGDPVCTP